MNTHASPERGAVIARPGACIGARSHHELLSTGRIAGRVATALAAFALLALSATAPALAHEAGPPHEHDVAATAKQRAAAADDRREAESLTDELKRGAANPLTRADERAALVKKAERRRDLLEKLVERDPRAVLDAALSSAERAALPAAVKPLVEEWVGRDGHLQVVHVDQPNGRGRYEVTLQDGRRETKLALGGPLGKARPGDRVRVSGVALAGSGTLVGDRVSVAATTSAISPTGPQRTAIILANSPGSAQPYADKARTASMFFSTSNPNSARAFYDEASYGQTTIVGGSGGEGSAADVYGPYTLGSATCNVSTIRNEAVAAADAEIDYNRYDRIVISWAHPACGSGGAGTVRGSYIGLFDGSHQYASIAWDFNAALGDAASARIGGVALHEYGHNLGVWHANALECGGAAISGGTCSSSEYGDPADVMGNTGGYGHPNAAHKDTLTWLGGGRTHDVGASGTYTLNGFEHPAGVKALRIPRTRDGNGAVTGYYYLEARRPNPTWGTFLSGRAEYDGGVLIHATNAAALCTSVCGPDFSGAGGGGDTHLIDTRPASQSGAADFNDAPLVVGESYSDPAAGVAITVTAADGNGVAVSVTLSPPTPAIQTVVYPENAGIVSGGGTFGVGQAATLVATPAPGYSFLRWREQRTSQSFPNPYTFAVAGDRMLEAVFGPGPSQPAPDNDSFTAPAILDTLPARVTAGTEGARLDTGEPSSVCGTAAPLGKTLWYSVTPQTASTLVISTAGSSFDTAVAVYTGDLVDALVQVACNDNNGSSPQAAVAIAAQANTTYRIQVGGVGWASGTLALDVSASAAPPQPNPNPTPNPNPSPSPTGVDLAITVDDGLTAATPGSVLSYTIVATNRGAAAASGATVQSTIPNGLAGARWTCTATAGSNCGEALGFGNIAARVDLAAGGSATFLVQGTVSLNGGRLINRARVVAPAGVTDSVPANNSATDADQIVRPADRFAAPTAVGRLGATSSRYAADTRRATTEPAEPTALPGCGTIGKTVWYTVRPTASGTVAISTADSDFDTVLAVYTGPTPASLTRVACNDNADDAQARLTFAAQAGQLYRVQVGGRQAAGGNLVVEFAAGPANDAFQRAAPLRLGDVRSAAGRVSVSTTWATTEASEPKSTQCGAIGKTSWYSFTPTRTGPVTVSTAGSTFNTVVAVYRGRALGGLTPLRCNDNAGGTVQSRVTFMARAGETYRIQVGGRDGAAGTLNLNLLAGS